MPWGSLLILPGMVYIKPELRKMNKIGHIICFEGIDGSGKDTQASLLFQYLQDKRIDSKMLSFPEYDKPIGLIIKQGLKNASLNNFTLQMLFAAERLSHLERIQELISNGTIIIADRYKWSGFVYAVSHGLPRQWAGNLETPLPNPDFNFLLDIDENTSISRSGGTDSYETNLPLLKKCRSEYLDLARQNKSWYIIDGNLPREEIHLKVLDILATIFK
jgi:dTMP kinase